MSFSWLNLITQPSDGCKSIETKNEKTKGGCRLLSWMTLAVVAVELHYSHLPSRAICHQALCTHAQARHPQGSPTRRWSTIEAGPELAVPYAPKPLPTGSSCSRAPITRLRSQNRSEVWSSSHPTVFLPSRDPQASELTLGLAGLSASSRPLSSDPSPRSSSQTQIACMSDQQNVVKILLKLVL